MLNITELEKKLSYKFNNQNLLKQALTHRSYSNFNYERLESVGDGILDYVIAFHLYTVYPKLTEGELSKIRAALVNQDALAKIAREISLGQYLILGDGEEKSNGRNRDSILADSLEAIFAAISFDANLDAAQKTIGKLFAESLQMADKLLIKDSKTLLQEYLQARKIATPEYKILDITGPDHESIFEVECVVNELNISVATHGRSKKEASQKAATMMLGEIERINK